MPEFTMQAVTSETGVPGDTLRSWQRRYGFPTPSRNDANYRLFSRRDIEAVTWVRDQTAGGQGTREAIAMMHRVIEEMSHADAPAVTPPSGSLVQSLTDALIAGSLDEAQRAWDRLAISVSSDALCNDVILPVHRGLRTSDPGPHARIAAEAFLLRKVMVLLDASGPQRGSRDVVVLIAGDGTARVPAWALATVLSGKGFRLPLPVMDIRDAESVIVMQQLPEFVLTIVVSPHGPSAVRHLLPNRELFSWWHDATMTQSGTLPASLLEAASALPDPTGS